MVALKGVYENGVVKFEEPLKYSKPVDVIVTFLEDEEVSEPLSIQDFSFNKTREKLNKYDFSLSDVVIDERRNEL